MAAYRVVRVMTWNIHKGIGGVDRRYSIQRVLGVMDHYRPDIALLQEVAQGMPQTGGDDQVEILRREDGLAHAAFHPEHQFRRGGYGNLILSRWPLTNVHHVDLTIGFRKRRGTVQARAHVPIGGHTRSFVIHNLHLGLAGSERGKQLERLLECHPFARLKPSTPLLVGGDLNDLWGDLGARFMLPAGFRSVGHAAATFPAAFPLRPLDGLFLRGDVQEEASFRARLGLARSASDHLPVIADLVLSSGH